MQPSHVALSFLLKRWPTTTKSQRGQVPSEVPVATPRRAFGLRAIPHCQNEIRQALGQACDS